jgi:hypothetical protein
VAAIRLQATGPKYAVLYMHDGQNLFDTATAGYGMEWQIDETLDRLIREKKVRPTIVVGIWNAPKRLQEYVPAKAFNGLPPNYRDKVRALYGGDPLSDGYLEFIVRELRAIINKRFNVKTGRAATAIMGSPISQAASGLLRWLLTSVSGIIRVPVKWGKAVGGSRSLAREPVQRRADDWISISCDFGERRSRAGR